MKYEVEYEASTIHKSNTEYGELSSYDLMQKKKEYFFYKNKEIINENQLANMDHPFMFGNELFSHDIRNSILVSNPVNSNTPIKEIFSKYTWFQGENCSSCNRSSNVLFLKQHSDFMTCLRPSDENYTFQEPFSLTNSNSKTNFSFKLPAAKPSSLKVLSSFVNKHGDHGIDMDSVNQYHNETKEIHITSGASLISRLCCYVEYKERGKTYGSDEQSSFTKKSSNLETNQKQKSIKKKEVLQTVHEDEIFQVQAAEIENNFLDLFLLDNLQQDQKLTKLKKQNPETYSDCSSVDIFSSPETNDEHDASCIKLHHQDPTDFTSNTETDSWFKNQYLVPTTPLAANNTLQVAVSNGSETTVKNTSITDLKNTLFNTESFVRLINLPSYKKIKSNDYRFSKRSSQYFKKRIENLKDVLPLIEEELTSESDYLPSNSIETSQKIDNFNFKGQTIRYQIEGDVRSDGNQSERENKCITLKGEALKLNDRGQTDGDQAKANISYIALKSIVLAPLTMTFVFNEQVDAEKREPLFTPVHQEINNTTKNSLKINNLKINNQSRTVSMVESKISSIVKNQQKSNFKNEYIFNNVHSHDESKLNLGQSKLKIGQSNNIIYDLRRKYSTASLLDKQDLKAVSSNFSLQNSIRSEDDTLRHSSSEKSMSLNEENETELFTRWRRKSSTNPFLLNSASQNKRVERLMSTYFADETNIFENESRLFENETSAFEKESTVYKNEFDLLEIKSQKKSIVKKITKATQYTESLSNDSGKPKKRSNLFRVDSYLSKNGNAIFKRKQERRLRHKNSVPDDMYSTNFDIANAVDEKGNSCLHIAAANSDISTIKYILKNGGNALKRNKNNCLPIDLARDFQTARLLSSAMLFYGDGGVTTVLNLK